MLWFQTGPYMLKYVNFGWSTVYGLGFAAAEGLLGRIATSGFPALFGLVLWPLLVFCSVWYLTLRLFSDSISGRTRALCVVGFLLTLTMDIQLQRAVAAPFGWLPLYQRYAFDVY